MTTSSRDSDWAVWMRAGMAGDAGAYRQFLVSVTPHVRTMARSRCRSLGVPEGEAEDVVQEVLLAIHLKRGTWDQAQASSLLRGGEASSKLPVARSAPQIW
jgi:DNA-directed RNA polymerase specialized sigma24 family protein